jgi:hypothetical protein
MKEPINNNLPNLNKKQQIIQYFLASVIIILFFASTTYAQQEDSFTKEDRELIKKLINRVNELETEVKELKAKQALSEISKTDNSNPNTSIAQPTEISDVTLADNTFKRLSVPNFEMRGYADLGFFASDLKGQTNTFMVGQFDLFITSQLSNTTNVLAELVLEADEENKFGFEVERLLLQYSPNDYLNLGVGRYHTAIGFYNNEYHHGTWFQTATGRPTIFDFEDEGGILPVHNVGITATGKIPSKGLGLSYIAEIGNGRRSRSKLEEPVQNIIDENNGKSFNLGFLVRPDNLPGFRAGFSFYHDQLTPQNLPKIKESIFATHAIYQSSVFELLNEVILVRHSLKGSNRVFNSPAFYTQISRRFGKFRPYFRYQYINVPADDPIISDVQRLNGPSFGLRYNATEFASIKLQYDLTQRRALKAINAFTLQCSFTF